MSSLAVRSRAASVRASGNAKPLYANQNEHNIRIRYEGIKVSENLWDFSFKE